MNGTLPHQCVLRLWLLLIVAFSIAGNPGNAAEVIDLGDLPGGDGLSRAHAVSGDGSTVVGYGTDDTGTRPFIWRANLGMVGLGDLPGATDFSSANDVSHDGSTVVGSSETSNGNEAFIWRYGIGMAALVDHPGGDFESWAEGVSGDGTTVVGRSSSHGAFIWTSATGMVSLGDLPGGTSNSAANAISADGTTVVGSSGSSNGWEAFRWTSKGGMVGLGDLPGGAFNSTALAVSGDGSTVVGHGINEYEEPEAWVWTAQGGMVGLGFVPGGGGAEGSRFSMATSVTADGSTVLGADLGWGAFVWDSVNGMRGLDAVLFDLGVTGGERFMSLATDISATGLTICGESGATAAVAILGPEPAPHGMPMLGPTAIALLGALLGISAYWRLRAS